MIEDDDEANVADVERIIGMMALENRKLKKIEKRGGRG